MSTATKTMKPETVAVDCSTLAGIHESAHRSLRHLIAILAVTLASFDSESGRELNQGDRLGSTIEYLHELALTIQETLIDEFESIGVPLKEEPSHSRRMDAACSLAGKLRNTSEAA